VVLIFKLFGLCESGRVISQPEIPFCNSMLLKAADATAKRRHKRVKKKKEERVMRK
jgi:hypothetical protein